MPVLIPANALFILDKLTKICSFELIPTHLIYIHFTEEVGVPKNARFEELGFEHHLFMENFGTLGFVFAMMPFLYFFQFLVSLCSGCKCCRNLS